jgi:hypothetical protein
MAPLGFGWMNVSASLAESEEEGTVNVTMAGREEGWQTPDESWLDLEAIEKGEMLFVNVVLGD